jgi:hypothetical protein
LLRSSRVRKTASVQNPDNYNLELFPLFASQFNSITNICDLLGCVDQLRCNIVSKKNNKNNFLVKKLTKLRNSLLGSFFILAYIPKPHFILIPNVKYGPVFNKDFSPIRDKRTRRNIHNEIKKAQNLNFLTTNILGILTKSGIRL